MNPKHSTPHRGMAAQCSPAVGASDRNRAAKRPRGETTRTQSAIISTVRICSIAIVRLSCLASLFVAPTDTRGAAPPSCQQASEPPRIHFLRTGIGEHYDIETGEVFGVVAKAFPDVTLQPVAHHGAACNSAGDGEPKSRMVDPVGPHDNSHELYVQPDTAGKDRCEVFPAMQPLLRPETPIGGLVLRQ